MNKLQLCCFSSEEIVIDIRELSARLHVPQSMVCDYYDRIIDLVRDISECKSVLLPVCFRISDRETVDFDFCTVHSNSLVHFLGESSQLILAVSTIGMGIERYLTSFSTDSVAERFIADAVSSSFVEGVCDRTTEIISKKYNIVTGRFSPGYGDLSIEFQRPLLEVLNASRLLGITLTESFLMIPRKSVSYLIGVCNNETVE